MSAPALAIIGCGNPNRRDDGAGPQVVSLLKRRSLPAGVALFDAGTDGMAVIYRARGAARLVIVDARRPEGAPGTVYEVPGEVLAAPPPQSFNLHDFRWDHALYAGRKLYGEGFPAQVRVFLIEAASLDFGLGLSPAVAAAAESVAERIARLAEAGGAGAVA
ncbi:hydrogenase maturation protease [Tistlia consotensis]|uniref:Hydrogenase maturation protease n=1 Tax=Tistlia consotensis USBA 355 TaxID=560819 RepID=A0A1Y6BXR6_9PROT|nr:hydrogenase maturation protease [Tistlia consotensis]SMF30699.1 hydrogenase maturation protease [Tistlia consotensis USBA 355]SNS19719.1 hydrogenase maturation protease [Tistlia consotensis]